MLMVCGEGGHKLHHRVNHIKGNEDKYHFLLSASKNVALQIQKRFNFKLSFKDHVESLCEKSQCQIK